MKAVKALWIMVMALALAPIDLHAQETGVGPWVKVNEKDGIIAYARTNAKVPFKEARCVGVINAPAENVERMMRDWDAYKRVLFMSKKAEPANVPGCRASRDTYCAYLLQGAVWPVQDRDGYGRMDFYIHQPTGEILVKITVGENNMPLTKGVTRIPFCEMEWMIKPIDATRCQVTYQNMLVPGGAIEAVPVWFVDYVLKNVGILTFENIRKLAAEEKYRQPVKGYLTTTPWPEDMRYYALEAKTK